MKTCLFPLFVFSQGCLGKCTGMLTAGNIDDRDPVPNLSKDLFGKLFGDRGYISQELFIKLYEKGTKIITRLKNNMKNKLMDIVDKILEEVRSSSMSYPP